MNIIGFMLVLVIPNIHAFISPVYKNLNSDLLIGFTNIWDYFYCHSLKDHSEVLGYIFYLLLFILEVLKMPLRDYYGICHCV